MSATAVINLTTSLGNKTKYINELKKTVLRPLIQLAVKAIGQEHIDDGILDRISEKYNIPQEKVDQWYSAVYSIIKVHLRQSNASIKINDFRKCLQELKMENECIEDLCAVLYGHKRPVLMKSLSDNTKFFPSLKNCRWKVDITISPSTLSKAIEPTILMEWTLSSGEQFIFELTLAKFHLLRYTVASLLLKMVEFENALQRN